MRKQKERESRLIDLVPPSILKSIQKGVARAQGIAVSFMDCHDRDYPLGAERWERYCRIIRRKSARVSADGSKEHIGERECRECDLAALERIKRSRRKRPYIYRCSVGRLVDFVCPIWFEGELAGVLFGGQIRVTKDDANLKLRSPSPGRIRRYWERKGPDIGLRPEDIDDLVAAYGDLKQMPSSGAKRIAETLSQAAQMVAEMASAQRQIIDFGTEMAQVHDLPHLLHTVAAQAAKKIGARRACVLLPYRAPMHRSRDDYGWYGPPKDWPKRKKDLVRSQLAWIGHVIRTKKPYLCTDPKNDPHYYRSSPEPSSTLTEPILYGTG